MSTGQGDEDAAEGRPGGGGPGFTELGKRIELLRIDRGLSKQYLARYAGTSRQQLWRVMTGKSELTLALGQRLAEALQVDLSELQRLEGAPSSALARRTTAGFARALFTADAPATLAAYASDVRNVERTLATLPAGADGRALKRELLNCIEDAASERGLKLPPGFFELRGRVVNDDG
jgi:transcriptional regulator with XRE-family HTH domain